MADDAASETAIKALNLALDEMQARARQLADSLRTLGGGSAAPLAAALSSNVPQRASGDIVSGELSKLLRQEITAGIAGVLSPGAGIAGSGFSVIIQNNSGAQVSARQSADGFDQKTLEITIDQMVANSLLRGRETSGVLRTLFGLVPTLIGR